MEAKCRKCNKFFPKASILVSIDGLYCEDCVPDEMQPLLFSFQMSWAGINALTDYIDGSRSLATLEVVDKIRAAIDKRIIEQIRGFIGGEIRQSDSESVESGDGEH